MHRIIWLFIQKKTDDLKAKSGQQLQQQLLHSSWVCSTQCQASQPAVFLHISLLCLILFGPSGWQRILLLSVTDILINPSSESSGNALSSGKFWRPGCLCSMFQLVWANWQGKRLVKHHKRVQLKNISTPKHLCWLFEPCSKTGAIIWVAVCTELASSSPKTLPTDHQIQLPWDIEWSQVLLTRNPKACKSNTGLGRKGNEQIEE